MRWKDFQWWGVWNGATVGRDFDSTTSEGLKCILELSMVYFFLGVSWCLLESMFMQGKVRDQWYVSSSCFSEEWMHENLYWFLFLSISYILFIPAKSFLPGGLRMSSGVKVILITCHCMIFKISESFKKSNLKCSTYLLLARIIWT